MNKILLASIIVANIILPGYCDSIIQENGNVINGKIQTVVDGLIFIKTEDGLQKVVREVDVGEARDIVEIGYLKRKKYVGRILFMDGETVEIATSEGVLTINYYKVRNMILAQDFSMNF